MNNLKELGREKYEKVYNMKKEFEKNFFHIIWKIFEKITENDKDNRKNEDKLEINLVLGLSGGPDSIFCYNLIKENIQNFEQSNIKIKLHAIYVNHMLREQAKEEEKYIERICKEDNIPFRIIKENICSLAKDNKKSIEEMGREVRYISIAKYINEKKLENPYIVLGHNYDDNAETIFMNILRGSGLNGIIGFSDISFLGNGLSTFPIIRPILNFKKKDIKEYLDINKIQYFIDESNLENIYKRNSIRNDIFKRLEKLDFNPKKSLNNLSYILKIYYNLFIKENYIKKEVEENILRQEHSKEIIFNYFDFKNSKRQENILKLYYLFNYYNLDVGFNKIYDSILFIEKGISNKKFIINKESYILIKKLKDKNKEIIFHLF